MTTTMLRRGRTDASAYGVGAGTLALALALKYVVGRVGVASLDFVLSPSAMLANRLGGLSLVGEAGAGYLGHAPRMVVGAACAGTNFLVIAWLALYFTLEARYARAAEKIALSIASALAAYGTTIVANGLRITLAAKCFALEPDALPLGPSEVHRLLGIVVYAGALGIVCRLGDAVVRRGVATSPVAATTIPLACYVGVAVIVPLANRAYVHDPRAFLAHAAVTVGAGAAVLLLFGLASRLISPDARRTHGLARDGTPPTET